MAVSIMILTIKQILIKKCTKSEIQYFIHYKIISKSFYYITTIT